MHPPHALTAAQAILLVNCLIDRKKDEAGKGLSQPKLPKNLIRELAARTEKKEKKHA